MFEKIKAVFSKTDGHSSKTEELGKETRHSGLTGAAGITSESAGTLSSTQLKQVAKLAKENKLTFAERHGQKGYTLDGQVQGKHYKMERGSPSRQYIQGTELRARCELDVSPNASLMIVNRHLKHDLDHNAFSSFTDTMQTMVNTNLPEEVLWLTMYSELGWPELGERFINDYAILGEYRDHARAIVQPDLVKLLTSWPTYHTSMPFVLMLMRGKMYLRMQFDDDTFTLEHAITTFTKTCEHTLSSTKALVLE